MALNPEYQLPSDSWANVRCDYQRNEVPRHLHGFLHTRDANAYTCFSVVL